MNIKKLRGAVLRRKQVMTPRRLDAETVLHQLTEIRAKIPFLEDTTRPVEDGRTRTSDGLPLQTVAEFEFTALEDAFTALADDKSVALARGEARARERAMQTNPAVEELSCDPKPEVFMELMKEMREVFEVYFREASRGKGEK